MFARSVASVAVDLGIPDWMIDIRHDATHKSLPCLDRLRMAAEYALGWLEEKYWKPQSLCLENAGLKVQECLGAYVELQGRLANMRREGKKTNKTEITLRVEQISSLSQYELTLLPERLVKCLEKTSFSFDIWKPLLVQLNKNKPHVLAHLIYEICRSYTSKFQYRQNVITFISSFISENLFGDLCKEQHSFYVDTLLKSQNNDQTRQLSSMILNHCSEKVAGKYIKLRKLFNILYLSKTEIISTPCSDISNLSDKLRAAIKNLENISSSKTPDRTSRFVECSEDFWECLPLGSTPDSIFPHLDTEQSEDDVCENLGVLTPPTEDCDVSMDIDLDQVDHSKSSRGITKSQLVQITSSVRILDDLD